METKCDFYSTKIIIFLYLCANYNERKGLEGFCVPREFSFPVGKVVEGASVDDAVGQNADVSAPVEGRAQTLELLLSGRVPNLNIVQKMSFIYFCVIRILHHLKGEFVAFQGHLLGEKIDAYRVRRVEVEDVVHEAAHQTRFAHRHVSQDHHLQQGPSLLVVGVHIWNQIF